MTANANQGMTNSDAVQAGAAALCSVDSGVCDSHGSIVVEPGRDYCWIGRSDSRDVLSAAEPIWRAQVADKIETLAAVTTEDADDPVTYLQIRTYWLERAAALVRGSE